MFEWFFIMKVKRAKRISMFFNRVCAHKIGTIWLNVANKSHEGIFSRQNENSTLYIVYSKYFKELCNISTHTLYIFSSHICPISISLNILYNYQTGIMASYIVQ